MSKKLSFLEEFIQGLLRDNGLGELTEENAAVYMPQLVAEAEFRIGEALLSKLTDEKADAYADLLAKDELSLEVWEQFWAVHVPDYKEVITHILTELAEDFREILAM